MRSTLFRRRQSEPAAVASTTSQKAGGDKLSGKGRPTPTRKEAEAAARARAKVPRTRKELAQAQRAARSESSANVRQAMKNGDERYLLPRDKGPVRRFVRDFVDVRFSFIELMIPLLIFTMVLTYSGSSRLAQIGNTVLLGTLLLVVVDMVVLRFRLKRELGRRFPDDSTKGTTYYAMTRALQMKFMRLPKSKVKVGQALPEDYR
ncbi:unannotated protein [freshwater metagenome]|uniref:Unannotated protein n=1 Tax=freshwater metagenome TaxID=449393 RepID=A0A6J6Q3N6_9ZZZZ